jgi:hypothetical protein
VGALGGCEAMSPRCSLWSRSLIKLLSPGLLLPRGEGRPEGRQPGREAADLPDPAPPGRLATSRDVTREFPRHYAPPSCCGAGGEAGFWGGRGWRAVARECGATCASRPNCLATATRFLRCPGEKSSRFLEHFKLLMSCESCLNNVF